MGIFIAVMGNAETHPKNAPIAGHLRKTLQQLKRIEPQDYSVSSIVISEKSHQNPEWVRKSYSYLSSL